MKHFKLILTSMRIIVGVLFVANVIFMMQLYNSIKTRYINDCGGYFEIAKLTVGGFEGYCVGG